MSSEIFLRYILKVQTKNKEQEADGKYAQKD